MATFYIEAVENTQIALVMVGSPTIGTVKYGVNDSTCPNTYTVTTESTPISLTAGQKCYWTITSTTIAFSASNYLNFTSTAKINVGGNLSDLIGEDTKIPRNYCFYGLFYNCTNLVSASNLVLVNDFNSKGNCYQYMFYNCTSLTIATELPATTLTDRCYYSMFQGCTSLTSAPELPATTLTSYCYYSMFQSCTSLTAAPELPATTLTDSCYRYMFRDCTSLTAALTLPATTLAEGCYNAMFYGCTNIKLSETQTAPYSIPYRIPSEGVGTATLTALTNMFTGTGGTFKGTPTINTTYYLVPYATFYIEAVEDTDITLSKVGTPTVGDAYYGVENHNVPNAYTYGDTIHLTAGQKCYWFITSTSTDFSNSNYLNFTSTAKINVGGNMSDLIGGDNKIPRNFCFRMLFMNCAKLVDASNLAVVNDFNSSLGCYEDMFKGCTSLIVAPELPATTLADSCYNAMFSGCTSLTTAPELPAITLTPYCYGSMFNGCTSLTTAPELPATTLTSSCYNSMFYGCTSLTTPPALPATTLASYCYGSMFYNCTSLTVAPTLPATTLKSNCYFYMFIDCTSLTVAPKLPATTLASNCYTQMFNGCTNIKLSETQTAPYLIPYRIPSEGTGTEGTGSLTGMFYNTGGTFTGTPTINTTYYITPYATFYIEAVEDTNITLSKVGTPTVGDAYYGVNDHGVPNAYSYGDTIHLTAGQKCYWFVTSTSTNFSLSNYLKFTSTAKINVGGNLSDLIGGETKIPRNYCFRGLFASCTKLVSASNLLLVNDFNSKTYCYYYMFSNCTSLTTAPELPATTLTTYCYDGMFSSCTSLTTAPELPATTLATYCYCLMFQGCTSLTIAPELPATTLADYCYANMFSGCTLLTTASTLPATTLTNDCYNNMFNGCTSLTTAPELPATTLADTCYGYMFQGCTSLITAPELPATTLVFGCYRSMFQGCSSLATAPQLPATTLADNCYRYMFQGCTNIRLSETQTAPYLIPYRIPSEGTGTVGASSLIDMFTDTSGTFTGTPTINTTYYLAPYATFYIEAVEDTDITLSKVGTPTVGDACYGINDHGVPNVYNYGDTIHLTAGQKCYWFVTSTSTNFNFSHYLNFTSTAKINVGGNLSDLIGGETKIPRNYCFIRLFYNCTHLIDASNLTIVNDFNSKTYCYNSMFSGCTSLTTPPALPATTLTNYCYQSIFNGCASLTTAPTLPATTLAENCYESMFSNCTSLTIAPELPATTLAKGCYYTMFQICTSLVTPPALPATTLADSCYFFMFSGCTSLTTPPALPATTLTNYCYDGMFRNCTNIKLSETQTAPYSIPYRIPSEGTGTEGTDSLTNMFYNTGGTFKGTPTINKIYYLAPPSSPIYITYKGQELANFETGSKTIKCGGKYMEGDVIIAREIGTNNVVVLYNSGTILTFQNGTKTLKCAGKGMATDLVIQTS